MTTEPSPSDPAGPDSQTNGSGNGNQLSATDTNDLATRMHKLETGRLDLETEQLKLKTERLKLEAKYEAATKKLQNSHDETNRLNLLTLLLGTSVVVVGAGLIIWTMELRAATLKTVHHKAGMLTQGEFIAGVTTGCLLILAVVVVLALWRRTFYPTTSTL